jgi:hypothetical protein
VKWGIRFIRKGSYLYLEQTSVKFSCDNYHAYSPTVSGVWGGGGSEGSEVRIKQKSCLYACSGDLETSHGNENSRLIERAFELSASFLVL